MAFIVNNNEIISDAGSANITHLSISSFGNLIVKSNTDASLLTPPHAGTLAGFNVGGTNPTIPARTANIERFLFATDGNTADVGDLTKDRARSHKSSSETHGYCISGNDGGINVPGLFPVGGGYTSSIEKFSFASYASARVGNVLELKNASGGGVASPTHAYSGSTRGLNFVVNQIERFPFANESTTSSIGNSVWQKDGQMESASLTHGYMAGGQVNPNGPISCISVIEKYAFQLDNDSVVVGDLLLARFLSDAVSSRIHGYSIGGVSPTPVVRFSLVDKFPFASERFATKVGDLSSNNASLTACSSSNDGYSMGGATSNLPPAPVTATAVIDKFPFATDNNASSVGNLTAVNIQAYGCQD
jgi:hypothetical protein